MKFILFVTAAAYTLVAFGNQCDNNGLTTIWDKGAILCDLSGSDGYDSFPIVISDHSRSCEQKLNSLAGKTLVVFGLNLPIVKHYPAFAAHIQYDFS